MRARILLLPFLAAAVASCDITAPLRVMSAEQPVDNLAFVDTNGANLKAAVPVTTEVLLYDKGNNVLEGRAVQWTSSDPAVLEVVSGTTTTASLMPKKIGSATITAEANGHTATQAFTVIPGAPAKLVKVTGDNQLGIVGENFLTNFSVQVTDAYDNSVTTVTSVTWQYNTATASTFSTNSSGISTVNLRPSAVGAGVEKATLNSTQASVSFTVTVTTMELGIVTGPPAAVNQNAPLTPTPVIELRYASDHTPYKRQGVTVTASVASGAVPTLFNPTAVTDGNGRATFTQLSMAGAAGNTTLQFSTTSPAASVTAAAATKLAPGAATKLLLKSTLPISSVTGQPFGTVPVLQLQDANNNDVAQQNVPVTAAIATGAGFTLANATVMTDANGTATFTDLAASATTLGQAYTLTFTSPGLTSVSPSASIQLTGPATQIVFSTTPPATAQCRVATPFVVQLRDAGNRNVAQPNVPIAATIAAGATIFAGGSASTDAAGKATFSTLAFSTASNAAPYSVTFTATGTSFPTISQNVSITGGPATQLKVSTEPSASVNNGAIMTQSPQVRLIDACGLNTAASSATITVGTTTASTVTFQPATATTSGGVATFSNLVMTGPAGPYTLRFTATGLTGADAAATTTLGVGAATRVVLTTAQSATAQSGVNFATQPVAALQDVGGNTVTTSGVTVTASIGATTLGTAVTTNGVATFTTLKHTGIAGPYTITYSAPGITNSATSTVTLGGAGTASQMVVTTQPSTGAMPGVTLSRTPVVQLQDVNGANVALGGVSIVASANPFVVGGGTGIVTDGTGAAKFTSLSVSSGTAGASNTFSFASTGLTTVQATAPTTLVTSLSKNAAVGFPSTPGGTTLWYGVNVTSLTGTVLTITIQTSSGTSVAVYVKQTDAPSIPGTPACSTNVTGTPPTTVCFVSSLAVGHYFIAIVPSGTTVGNITATW